MGTLCFCSKCRFVASVYIDGLLVAETDIFNLPPFSYQWMGALEQCTTGSDVQHGNDSYLRQTMIYTSECTPKHSWKMIQGDVMDVPATLEMLNSATMPSGLIPVGQITLISHIMFMQLMARS